MHKQESTTAGRYICKCVCVCVVLQSGDGVEGACPRACSLSSLYKGPVCSPWWHLTQCLSSSPVSRALCPATRPVNAHTHTQSHACTSPALRQPDYDAHSQARTRTHGSDTLGKANPPLSWITDIQTASRSLNNLISAHPVALSRLQRGLCLRQISLLTQCDSLAVETRQQHLPPPHTHFFPSPQMGFSFILRSLRGRRERREEGGEGEITFSAGRAFSCIIHRMKMNLRGVYRFLITSALCGYEYA